MATESGESDPWKESDSSAYSVLRSSSSGKGLLPQIFLPLDAKTMPKPDDWVERSPDLIPVTGFHPFNAEPELSKLVGAGMITPTELHYVRNHSDVPKLKWQTHVLEISGLVKKTVEFRMDELLNFPQIEAIVTISCNGNRRKEINMSKRTKSFHYGAGAISTSIWKGVPLHALLKHCGVNEEEAKYVCFYGADDLPFGKYGTDIPIEWAMDETKEFMIAFEMNGKPLPPDHGYPIRMVCPGMAGARSVKWLRRIVVSKEESESWYHYHDNRLFPPEVDFSNFEGGDWAKKQDYLIYDMNVNSVITCPSHYEWLDMSKALNPGTKFVAKGYAYSGGGKRITRVDVTIDGGVQWLPCKFHYPDQVDTKVGKKVWSWCFWECEIPMHDLLRASSIAVRAHDEAFNTQPEHFTWNLLGLMNNSWYKVEIIVPTSESPSIVFRHPVLPGGLYGGYLRPPPPAFRVYPSALPLSEQASAFAGKHFTLDEIQKHNKKDDCWIIIGGEVYDVTNYLKDHPGGATPIVCYSGGVDATAIFDLVHAQDAKEIKERYLIGKVFLPERAVIVESRQKNCQVNPRTWLDVHLLSKKQVSPDSYVCLFELKDKSKPFGLAIGQHVLVGADIDGEFVVRPYTPIRPVTVDEDEALHGVEILMKVYKGGKMGTYFQNMKTGDKISIKGPTGQILYEGNGCFSIHDQTICCEQLSLIAGGSGITPIIQLIRAIIAHNEVKPKIKLLYSNKTEEDILLRHELDTLAEKYPDRFQVWYTVTRVDPKEMGHWKYSIGRISTELMIRYLYPPTISSAVFVCGPSGMIQSACFPGLISLGYDYGNMFEF